MVLGQSLVIVVVLCFLPSCEPDSASAVHLHGFDEVRMHPYDHPLHRKVLKHYVYIKDEIVIQSEVVLGLSHVKVVVVFFLPSCEPDSASSAHAHDFDEVKIHPYDHSLHQKVLKHFIDV